MNNNPKELLRACAENLLNAVTHLESTSVSRQIPLTSQSAEVPAQCSSPIANSIVNPTATVRPRGPTTMNRPGAAEEHRNLFGYRPPASARSIRPPQPKSRRVTTSTGNQVLVPVRNTWSRTFVCLLKRSATTAPCCRKSSNGSCRFR